MRWGGWGADLDRRGMEYLLRECLSLGLDTFDHADIYGGHTTEKAFGDVLRKHPELRSRIKVVTKCGIQYPSSERPAITTKHYDSSKAHIIQSVERSLKNFGLDALDMLLLHRPDFLIEYEEVAEAFDQLNREGKVRAFGVSNFSIQQVEQLKHFTAVSAHQFEFSLNAREALDNGLLDQCKHSGIEAMAWGPMGGGALMRNLDERYPLKSLLEELADAYRTTMDAIVLAWVMRHPSCPSAVIGTIQPKRIMNAWQAQGIQLSRQDWYRLLETAQGHRVP